MKTLKFAPHLVEKILIGEKTSTWRLFDDKDLTEGDELTFVSKETGEEFGTAVITSLHSKTLGTLTDADWEGHERFASEEEMYETYRGYYGNQVNEDSVVKILSFDFMSSLKGFYVHYKHNPEGELHNYMYEVAGMARNTEEKTYTVLYRPLYKNEWLSPADYQSRPLDMFIEAIEKDGVTMPRFARVTDSGLVKALEEAKIELYG